MTIHISKSLHKKIQDHSKRYYPEESAGLIIGVTEIDVRRARVVLLSSNIYHPESRNHRYMIGPKDMLFGELEAEKLGMEVIGIFHSHPDHPANPSEFDRQWALPWYSYVITSVYEGKALETRSWRLVDDRSRFIEESLEVIQTASMEVPG